MKLVDLWKNLEDFPDVLWAWDDEGVAVEEIKGIADMTYFILKYGARELSWWTIGYESRILNVQLKEEEK